ncbi:hypothetical protein CFP56_020803 [Quercus suber]|uniref:Uncharacterized protein n=1 Tax=Quercus suber TaxID=58331 RepID=A0AAW0KGV4_QUESU
MLVFLHWLQLQALAKQATSTSIIKFKATVNFNGEELLDAEPLISTRFVYQVETLLLDRGSIMHAGFITITEAISENWVNTSNKRICAIPALFTK